jgi:tetratricopeptide (TPR) repeat protein
MTRICIPRLGHCLTPLRFFLPALLALCLSAAVNAVAQTPAPPPQATASTPASDLGAIRVLIDQGHAAEALKQLDTLAAQKPEPAGVERLRGIALYAQNHFEEADHAFAAALAQDPKDVESAEMRGLTLYRINKPAEAIIVLQNARDWSANSKVDPSYVLALCYMEVRRFDDARHAYAHQYGLEPDSAAAYLLIGRMLFRKELIQAAQDAAHKAVTLNPQIPLAHMLLGEIALSQQRLDEAVTEFEKERAINPLNGGVYDRLGDAYSRANEYEKAQQSLQRAMLLEPNSTAPYILIGKALLRRQDPVNAAGYLERAAKMDPANSMTHSLLGQAYRSMGKFEEAAREAATAQKLQTAARSPEPAQ